MARSRASIGLPRPVNTSPGWPPASWPGSESHSCSRTARTAGDLYYGIYIGFVAVFFVLWAMTTEADLSLPWSASAGCCPSVSRSALRHFSRRSSSGKDATPRPDDIEPVAAVLWRGVAYGLADGLFLSAFPILAVFAVFEGTRLRKRFLGTIAVGLAALAASMAMTATYHAGYRNSAPRRCGNQSLEMSSGARRRYHSEPDRGSDRTCGDARDRCLAQLRDGSVPAASLNERRCKAMLTAEEYKKAEFDLSVADERRGFKVHACVYAVVNTGLIAPNALLWGPHRGRLPVGDLSARLLGHRTDVSLFRRDSS